MKDFIQISKKWVYEFIIAYNICPFAKEPMENGEVDWIVLHDLENLQRPVEEFIDSEFKTKFIIFPELKTFPEYLDVGYFCEDLIVALGYETDLKVVHFHPEHLFEGLESDDEVNFSNRSPFPMLQLLREKDLDALQMTESWKQNILDRNASLLKDLGYKKLTNNLNEYRK